jgi:preprotein translocase subunit SecG
METMHSVVLIGHTLIAVLIIVLVLLQRGKGADAGAAFGAGASGTVFGAKGSSNFFSRATAVLATLFFVSSLTLAYISSQRATAPESLVEDSLATEVPTEPEMPGTDDDSATEDFPDLPDMDGAEPAADDSEMPALGSDEPTDDNGEQ